MKTQYFILTIMIVVIVGMIVGGTYYLGAQTEPTTPGPSSTPSTTPLTTPSTTSEIPATTEKPSANPALSVMTKEVWDLVLTFNSSYPFKSYEMQYENISFIRGKALVFSGFDAMPEMGVFDVESLLPSETIAKSPNEKITIFAVYNPRDYTSNVYVVAVYLPEKILVGPQAVFINYSRANSINTGVAEWILSLPSSDSPPAYTNRTPMIMEIGDAIARGLIKADISGGGLQDVTINLESYSDNIIEVIIQPATVFEVQTAGVQNMVALYKSELSLEPRSTVSSYISVACFNMESDQPSQNDSFILSRLSVPEDLSKLLNLSDFRDEAFRVKQFAIWTITENPTRNGYVGLTTGFLPFGSGPSETEMQQIHALFDKAGIFIPKYRAFQSSSATTNPTVIPTLSPMPSP